MGVQDIHIWHIPLQRPATEITTLHALLSPEEQQRAARYHFHADRRRFSVARGALRLILSQYLDRPAATLQLAVSPHGKPFVPRAHHRFNVTHSHELALIGVTFDRPVGIDCEYHRRPLEDAAALIDRYFSPFEQAVFHALPAEQQQLAFFNGWTRKEAYIKARGTGLSHPLDAFDVEIRPGQPVAFLNINQDPAETARWSLHAFTPAPDYTAALATPGHNNQYHYFDFAIRLK